MNDEQLDRERWYAVVRVTGEIFGVGMMEVVSAHSSRREALEAFMSGHRDKHAMAVQPIPCPRKPEPGDLHPFEPLKCRDRDASLSRALDEAMERTSVLSQLSAPGRPKGAPSSADREAATKAPPERSTDVVSLEEHRRRHGHRRAR